MKRRKAIAAVLAAVLSLVSASAAYAEELSEQEMTKQEAAEVLDQEPTEQEAAELRRRMQQNSYLMERLLMRRRMQSRWRGNISLS